MKADMDTFNQYLTKMLLYFSQKNYSKKKNHELECPLLFKDQTRDKHVLTTTLKYYEFEETQLNTKQFLSS